MLHRWSWRQLETYSNASPPVKISGTDGGSGAAGENVGVVGLGGFTPASAAAAAATGTYRVAKPF